jgi:hypothetical protein
MNGCMANEIIEALGGNKAVAALLNVRAATVSVWRKRGIPWRYRGAVRDLLRRKRIAVPEGFMKP